MKYNSLWYKYLIICYFLSAVQHSARCFLSAIQRFACCFVSAVQHSAPHFSFRLSELCNGCGSVILLVEQKYVSYWLVFQRSFGVSTSCRDVHFFRYGTLSHDDVVATCLQRDGGLAQRRHSCTIFQIRTSRRRCATCALHEVRGKPLVICCAFVPYLL